MEVDVLSKPSLLRALVLSGFVVVDGAGVLCKGGEVGGGRCELC